MGWEVLLASGLAETWRRGGASPPQEEGKVFWIKRTACAKAKKQQSMRPVWGAEGPVGLEDQPGEGTQGGQERAEEEDKGGGRRTPGPSGMWR